MKKTDKEKNSLKYNILIAVAALFAGMAIYRFFILPENYGNKLYDGKYYGITIGKRNKAQLLKLKLKQSRIKKLKKYFKPVKFIKISPTVRKEGRLIFAAPLVRTVSLKFSGYVSKVYADKEGVRVRKNHPLFSIYSPALINAQNDYILAYKNYEHLKNTSFKTEAYTMYASAEKKLLFWGLNKEKISAIKANPQKIIRQINIYSPINGIVIKKYIEQGEYIKPGSSLYKLADTSKLWIKIMLSMKDLKFIHKNEKIRITLPKNRKSFYGDISYIYPYAYNHGKLIKIRISAPNKKDGLKIGSLAYVSIKFPLVRLLTVPASCVAFAGYKDVVLVYKGGGIFNAKSVILGKRNRKYYSVIRGLKPGEDALELKNIRGINRKTLNKIYHYIVLSSTKMKIA